MHIDFSKVFSGKRVLVSGGAGFIGSHLALRLVELGADVTIVDILDPDSGANLFNIAGIEKQARLIIADMNDLSKVGSALQGQDFLFQLAGQVSHISSMQDPLKDIESNAISQLKVLEFCRLHTSDIRVVFAGTRQVYGRPRTLPVNEEHPLAPADYNGVSKLAGDLYHIVCNQAYGLWTTVLRLTNVYGPHMRVKDSRQTFIGWWIRQLLEEKELEIFGDGQQLRDLNYVDDVVEAMLLCAANPSAKGQIYNLGNEPIRLLDLARLMIEINGRGAYRLTPFPLERQRIDIGDYYGDYSKIHSELGWQPAVPLQDGLERTLAFYRQHNRRYWQS